MPRFHPALAGAAILIAILLCGGARADVVPVAVAAGACELVVDTSRSSGHCYLVIGSLADAQRTTRVMIRTEPTDAPEQVPAERMVVPAGWRALVQEQAARQEQARKLRRPAVFTPPVPPAPTRVFHVFIKDRELANAAHYAAATAELRAVGRHCQVYVDRAALDQHGLAPLLDDILRTFDEDVFPWASRRLGSVHDVDRDGRFTIFLTPLLGKLQNGAVAVDGFVRGSDFERDRAAPFSNRCDMMYLNSRLQPGPHLRTLLAHEYTHAVLYCEHVLETYLSGAAHQDEEGWLNEGIAHLVEEQLGYGWSNLEHRISAYLSWPERYPLVVPDYFHAGLWRTAGTRGATFLFLRSCRERHGLELLTRLARSSLGGVPNLEAATGERFDELFRRWGVAQLVDGAAWMRQAKLGRLCVGPRCHDVILRGDRQEFAIAGTAMLYLRLHSPGAARTRVRVEGELLQVTLVRPAAEQPWLELHADEDHGGSRFKLRLTAHGGDVRIEAAAWERLLPTGKAHDDTSYFPDDTLPTAPAWFGSAQLLRGPNLHKPGDPPAGVDWCS